MFYKNLESDWKLPKDVNLIYPFENKQVWSIMQKFYSKYYSDKKDRCFVFGINPGRLGAGMTGVPFTDPIRIETKCGIENDIKKKQELSSVFIYEMIEQFGSVQDFYSKIYISSVCPLGFTKDGKNYNYYDSKELYAAVENNIISSITKQVSNYCRRDKAFSLGQGTNFKYLKKLNEKHNWFDEVIPLPHPRWIMQYRLKKKQIYLDEFDSKLAYLF